MGGWRNVTKNGAQCLGRVFLDPLPASEYRVLPGSLGCLRFLERGTGTVACGTLGFQRLILVLPPVLASEGEADPESRGLHHHA